MAFDSLISGLVDTAFTTVGDLAKDISLDNEAPGEYNFSTGTVVTTTPGTNPVTIKGIVQSIDRPTGDKPYIQATVLFKTSDVGELDGYDTATFDNNSYKLKSYEDNGYTVTAILTREV